MGSQTSTIDFVVSLGLVMGIFNILIINPGLRLLFNIGRKRPPHENTFWQRLSDYLVELLKNIFIMFAVAMIYRLINQVLVTLLSLPADAVPLPGEPILFGAFYVFVFVCLEWITKKARAAILNFSDGNDQR